MRTMIGQTVSTAVAIVALSGCALYPLGPGARDFQKYCGYFGDFRPPSDVCNLSTATSAPAANGAAASTSRTSTSGTNKEAQDTARADESKHLSAIPMPAATGVASPPNQSPALGMRETALSGIAKGVNCAKRTQELYGSFLICREKQQMEVGGSVAILAAGAAGVASAGISTVSAASLGATAGALLGFDFVSYNKAKTKAYADGVVQLRNV